jgi:hypothetical protein
MAFAHSYGGEAIYRVYLFSLPWAVALVASLVRPVADALPRVSRVVPAVALLSAFALFLPAQYGSDMEFRIPPAEVAASEYFYTHAQPGSVLLSSINFPSRVGGTYGSFALNPNGTDPYFLDERMWGRMLTAADLPLIEHKLRTYASDDIDTGYLVLSTSQQDAATLLGILPDGSLESLEQALLQSTDWEVFYRNDDTTIFRFLRPLKPLP